MSKHSETQSLNLNITALQVKSQININTTLNDVVRLFRQNNNKFVDTDILKPPLGTIPDNSGADMEFLHDALSIAHSDVYSLHKTTTQNVS
ncbi:Methyltransferase-like protein [Schistosoma japonicum]|nr:Methyltransferase-like protein [Schistosoma japonicum]